ncbi:AAA family ATPase [Desulfurispira natronophila]|uniref:ATPase AAA-type core domain-containing protein n=1 Tax=Desulfurispira natronophila TaxID=682562 RepID=A0A7W7Y5M6_9BACT|nr:ATP-binding protein [Desulfurispira natronophila]MBB5022535.1 hypothetical protein [Desulfurispira natronophila]
MLVEFSVANFRSMKERQTLSMVRAKGAELLESNTFVPQVPRSTPLVRSAALYGPNSAGKTNVIQALRAMREIVLGSASTQQRGDKLPIIPFRIDKNCLKQPSEFEAIFISDGIRYQYGFRATNERVHEEWLFAFPKGYPQEWIHRTWDEQNSTYNWAPCSKLQGEKQLWQKSTRENALFLSTAVQLNSIQLQPIYDWFKSTLKIIGVGGVNPDFSVSLCEGDSKKHIMEFLKAADLGIEDMKIHKEKFDLSALPSDMPLPVKEHLLEEFGEKEIAVVQVLRKNDAGELVVFDIDEDESSGTRKIFAFAGPWYDSLKNGNVLVIDELHTSLHPALVEYMVQLFHGSKTSPGNAQLIFTTHETSILSQEIFRRDQVWFCDKDEQQSTRLYPLTDFSPKKGRENLEAAYLAGRYGAIPLIGDLLEV